MSNIETTYKEKILNDILLEMLQGGVVPTAGQLETRLQEFLDKHPDLTKPVTIDLVNTVERLEESSALKYNATFQSMREDLSIVMQEIITRTQDAMQSFDRWKIEIEFLSNKLRDLNSRIDGLLLLQKETSGFFDFVEDNLIDFSKIDQVNTNVEVDIYNHVVSIGRGKVLNTTSLDKLNLNGIKNTDIVFTVLTRDFLVSVTPAPRSELRNVFLDQELIFQNRLLMSSPRLPISVELKAKLSQTDPVEISKIIVDLHAANNSSNVVISAQYSIDNYNWFNVPTNNHTQMVDKSAYFVFDKVEAKYIKFIMTKSGSDDIEGNRYVYEFGIKQISLFQHSFDTSTGSVFISKELEVFDKDSQVCLFNRVALEACETIPEDTDIEYYMSAYNDSLTEFTEWIRVDPINRVEPMFMTVADFGGLGVYDNKDGITSELDTTTSGINSENLNINRLDGGADLGYNFINSQDVSVNFFVPAVNVLELLDNVTEIKRNIGDRDTILPVRGIKAGWGFEDPYYFTVFEVYNPDGVTVDFGVTTAELDGAVVSGKTSILAGRHTFRTHKNNWSLVDINKTTENDLRVADILYPFNHRLIIEGYTYDSIFAGNQVYVGTDIFYQYYMQRISIFDFANNLPKNDYSRFSTDILDNGKLIFLVKYNNTISDNVNEKLRVSYKLKDSTFSRLKFKAVLKTINSQRTPLITAYRLKIAN